MRALSVLSRPHEISGSFRVADIVRIYFLLAVDVLEVNHFLLAVEVRPCNRVWDYIVPDTILPQERVDSVVLSPHRNYKRHVVLGPGLDDNCESLDVIFWHAAAIVVEEPAYSVLRHNLNQFYDDRVL